MFCVSPTIEGQGWPGLDSNMVSVAQSVESRIVIPVVVGSSPIVHPNFPGLCQDSDVMLLWGR